MKSLFILLTGLALNILNPSFAQVTGSKWGFGFKGGAATYFGENIDQRNLRPHFAFSMDHWLTNMYSLGVEIGNAVLEVDADPVFFHSNTFYFMADIKFKPLYTGKLHSYFLAGAEMLRLSPKDRNGRDFLPDRTLTFDQFKFSVPLGGGISFFIKDDISLDLQGIYHFAPINYVDTFNSPSDGDDDFMTVGASINFYFGGENADRDLDGIPDVVDICPDKAEDLDGYFDDDGCPDTDNDEDGIPDAVDACPNDAEDYDDFQDDDGCPDTDNDGDGLPDYRDRCPGSNLTVAGKIDTREDMDGFQDRDGCPDNDNDGDGFADAVDACPNNAETFNGFEDEDGCPDEKPGIVFEKENPLVLEVYFQFGRAALDPNSESILDRVVASLKSDTLVTLEIRGYTDIIGTLAANKRLSQQRAESVRNYFIQKGIEPKRLSAKGFGPADPIASNQTAEGRAKNRRIELRRLN